MSDSTTEKSDYERLKEFLTSPVRETALDAFEDGLLDMNSFHTGMVWALLDPAAAKAYLYNLDNDWDSQEKQK